MLLLLLLSVDVFVVICIGFNSFFVFLLASSLFFAVIYMGFKELLFFFVRQYMGFKE